jgi:FkbM family methyltransferase
MSVLKMCRAGGRWMMEGPRRRRIYEQLNQNVPLILGNRVRRGHGAGLRFAGGDTVGYLLGVSEPEVQQVLADCLVPGAVLYDVGAHAGFMTLIACRLVGPTGHVHAFEPIPANIETIRRNLAANRFGNATLHELALSDVDGPARMATGPRNITAHIADTGETMVTAARCDALDLDPPTMVKIDVEGAESRVLAGMKETLRRHRPVVVVEIHGEQREPVELVLTQSGYRIQPLNGDGMPHLLATHDSQSLVAPTQ